jgi:phasin family protein
MKTVFTPEQFAATNAANIDNLLKIAKIAFEGAERLAQLNLRTVQAALKDGVAKGQTLMSARDMQELAATQAELAQPLVDQAVSYARGVYDIATDGQKRYAAVVEEQIAALNRTFATALNQAAQAAPQGAGPAFEAVKSAMAMANTAYDALSASAKQFADTATANANATVEAGLNAARKTAAKKPAKKA